MGGGARFREEYTFQTTVELASALFLLSGYPCLGTWVLLMCSPVWWNGSEHILRVTCDTDGKCLATYMSCIYCLSVQYKYTNQLFCSPGMPMSV